MTPSACDIVDVYPFRREGGGLVSTLKVRSEK